MLTVEINEHVLPRFSWASRKVHSFAICFVVGLVLMLVRGTTEPVHIVPLALNSAA